MGTDGLSSFITVMSVMVLAFAAFTLFFIPLVGHLFNGEENLGQKIFIFSV